MTITRSILIVVWIAAMYAILHAEPYLPLGEYQHALCGPWATTGCGPTLASLIVVHGFWLALAAGLTALVISVCSRATLRTVGLTLIGSGVCALFGLAIWEMFTLTNAARPYVSQRYFFLLATTVDLPIIPAMLAGFAYWIASRRETKKKTALFPAPSESNAKS